MKEKRNNAKSRDPWIARVEGYDNFARYCSAEDRMSLVRRTNDLPTLVEMADWGDTQKTVRAAARSKIRRLKTLAAKGGATGSDREHEEIAKIAAAKKGHYIRMRCWTEATHSSAEAAAKSITDAVRFIRLHGPLQANWSIEYRSEAKGGAA